MSGTHGLLQPNQPGYFYITLEESYVTLFKISAEKWFEQNKSKEDAEKDRNARSAHAVAKAYITDVLIHLSNDLYKTTKSERNLWVFLSFPQLESRLHGGVKMRTLKEAMKEMIDDGYVFKRPNRDPRYKSLEYCLNLPKYRKELDTLPSKLNKDDSANMHDEIDDANSPDDSANMHPDSANMHPDSANLHPDSANLHDDNANLHDDNANLHDDSANLHPIRNIDLTKTNNIDSTERKNAAPSQEKANVSDLQPSFSHSSIPQSSIKKSSFSSETKPEAEEATLSEEEQVVYDLACQRFFVANPPRITPTVKGYCAQIAKAGLKTTEQMKDLEQVSRQEQRLGNKPIYLGNLARGLNGWLQTLKQPAPQQPNSSRQSIYVVDQEANERRKAALRAQATA